VTMSESALQYLLDLQHIRDLMLNYCRAIDRRDFDGLQSLYDDSAIDDHGGYVIGAAKDFIELLPKIMRNMQATSHQIANHLIEIDGDYAEGEAYFIAYHLTADADGNDTEWIAGGRYLDHYIRRESGWKIHYRKVVLDWNQVQTSLSRWDAPMFTNATRAGFGDSDPSTSFFRLLGKH